MDPRAHLRPASPLSDPDSDAGPADAAQASARARPPPPPPHAAAARPFISVRLASFDTYMAPPSPELAAPATPFAPPGTPCPRVPVIRVFGATPDGQRACLHIHGVLPYLYVRYKGPRAPEDVQQHIFQLGISINHAVAVSLNRHMGDPSRSQFVASIVLVKGIPFYGFHAGYEPFLKIYLFNPNLLSRVAALLQNGAVLGRVMDTYESHIPYLLQFQLDYNLCGMEFIHLAYARFRMPCVGVHRRQPAYTQLHLPTSPGGSDVDQPPHDPGDAANRGDPNLTSSQESNRVINAIHPYRFWTDETIRREWQWPQNSGIRRKSYCELELDTWPCEIMNRFAVQERPMHALVNNPDRVFEDNACQLVPSLAAIWDDEQRRRDALGLAPLETTTIHASTYHATYTPWNAESRLRASMENIIEQLKAEQHAASQAERDPLAPEQSSNPLADHAAAFSDWVDDGVPTAFQAVSWLHPPRRYFRVPPSKDETTVDTDEPATPEHAPDTTLPDAEPSDALRPEESTPLRGVVSPAKSTLSHNTSTSVIVRETVELLAGISSQLSSFSSHTPIIDKAAITRALTQQRDAEEEEEEETDQDNEAGLDDIPAENQDEEFSVDEDDPGIDDDADGHGFAAMATDEPQQREAAEEQASAAYSSNAPNVFALHADPEIAHELAEIQMLFPDGLSDVGSQPLSAAASEATGGPRSPLTQRRRRESGDGPGSASLRSLATRHIPQFDGDGDGDDHDADASVVQRTPPDTDEAAAHQRPQDGVPARQRPQLTTPQASKRVRFTADPTPKQDAAFSDHFADSIHGMWSPVAPPHSGMPALFSSMPDPATPLRRQQDVPAKQWTGVARPERPPSDSDSPPSLLSPPPGQIRQSPAATPARAGGPTLTQALRVLDSQASTSISNATGKNGDTRIPAAALSAGRRLFKFRAPPPSAEHLISTLRLHDLPSVVYQEPFFSVRSDVPARPREIAGREFKLKGDGVEWLPSFDDCISDRSGSAALINLKQLQAEPSRKATMPRSRLWTLASRPPTPSDAAEWLTSERARQEAEANRTDDQGTKPDGPPANGHAFKHNTITAASKEHMHLLSLEVHVQTRDAMLPDPAVDAISAVFFCLQHEDPLRFYENGTQPGFHVGMIVVDDGLNLRRTGLAGIEVIVVPDERQLFEALAEMVRSMDPSILTGYEIQASSWGYAAQRADAAYGMNLCEDLSAVVIDEANASHAANEDRWGYKKQSSLHATGRIFLNLWRLMKRELTLVSYTLENTVNHVLRKRIPRFSHQTLTEWWNGGMLMRWRTIKYYIERVQLNLELLDGTQLIARTSEFAKVSGVDFYSVVIRGSQYKVESVLLRITKPENFVLFSPSHRQIKNMRAFESIPLIMEPRTELYSNPILVLDFQSLYPSVMIAYNFLFGAKDQFHVPVDLLDRLKDHVHVTPNGIVFAKEHIRKSALARMVSEILDTRIMVKKSMKLYQHDKALLRILDAKQQSLKLLANVTYGYTAASFSGRMPCEEVADAIVGTSRATLERAILTINSHHAWNARVMYGDTDSIFVQLAGRTKDEAFATGNQIVRAITAANPDPVKLKFEKVYLPCFLLAKKRYVGFMYENQAQKDPVFDAKGIETVRRDGCPIVSRMVEESLSILFRTKDLSQVKTYLYGKWTDILAGRILLKDFIIAKEVKLGKYSSKGQLPPGAHLATKRMETDKMAGAQYGERVPYVVVHSGPKHRLVDAVVSPHELLSNRALRLHATYYITKQINPALARMFNLIGADVEKWFQEMPKIIRVGRYVEADQEHTALDRGRTIDQFYVSRHCIVCWAQCQGDLCPECQEDPSGTLAALASRVRSAQQRVRQTQEVCRACTLHDSALDADSACVSLCCPVFFMRKSALNEAAFTSQLETRMAQIQRESEERLSSEFVNFMTSLASD